jgi:uncharacterized membrane protein (DUF485 family)
MSPMPLHTTVPTTAIDPGDERWQAAVETAAFRRLTACKRWVLVPMVTVYLGTFLGVCLLAGFARPWFAQPAAGGYSNGNVLIAGTYLLSWALALVYVWIADHHFDRHAAAAIAAVGGQP